MLAVLAALLVLGVRGDGRRTRFPNVLLIVVDTLRADHLAAYGYPRETAPTITRLAAGGARFSNAYSQGASTVPTFASLFTGRFPFQHGTYDVRFPLRADERTMAEFFRAHGYRTFGVASSVRFNRRSGFWQGFETFRPSSEVPKNILSRRATSRVLEFLRADDPRPVFGFVHYLGPHQPYAAPEPFRSRWTTLRADLPPERTSEFLLMYSDPDKPLEPDVLDYLKALYDGEISYLDTELERLFATIARERLAEDLVVVLTADHGDEFKEHGGLSHGRLHEEILRVPLIVWWPGRIRVGRVIARPVQTIDLFPTLASLTGLPMPERVSGRDLRPLLLEERAAPEEGDEMMRDMILSQQQPGTWALMVTLAGRRFKYLVREDAPPALYDLTDDPGGTRDVLARFPGQGTRMRAIALQLGVNRPAAPPATLPPSAIPKDVRDRLRALGYVDEAGGAPAEERP